MCQRQFRIARNCGWTSRDDENAAIEVQGTENGGRKNLELFSTNLMTGKWW